MALQKRHLLAAGRLAAAAGVLGLRGHSRLASWMVHDLLWLAPTLCRNGSWHGEVVTRFATTEREIWLTIDDGPDPRDTPDILDLLARHGAVATFFVVGKKVEQNRALCRRIVDEGHTLGNHTYSHPAGFWWALPPRAVEREITLCHDALLAATGQRPRFFRSPVGMNNRAVHPAAHRHDLRVAGWSAAGCDGCPAQPTPVVSRIMSSVQPGAIILLHESGASRHRVLTLSRLLTALDGEGYHCVLPPESALS